MARLKRSTGGLQEDLPAVKLGDGREQGGLAWQVAPGHNPPAEVSL